MSDGDKDVRCLVIGGGGASGTAALRQLISQNSSWEVKAYEPRSKAGGVWLFEGDPEPICFSFDREGRPIAAGKNDAVKMPSAIYNHLHTNLPFPLMSFRDIQFPSSTPLYPSHEVVTKYLQDACLPVEHCITYNRKVVRLRHTPKESGYSRRWLVESRDLLSQQVFEEDFDYIAAANGHFYQPYVPYIRDLWKWAGRLEHARAYRLPHSYTGRTIVVGGNASGYDITRDIASHHYTKSAKWSSSLPTRVYQSVRSPESMFSRVEGHEGAIVSVVGEISHIAEASTVILKDGTRLEDIDTILFATGYLYQFEFCSQEDEPFRSFPLTQLPTLPAKAISPELPSYGVYPQGGLAVHNLDKMNLFYYPDPTLAFLGLLLKIVPFPFAETQCRAVAARWAGCEFALEPADSAADESALKDSLVLGEGQWDYEDNLMRLIGEGKEQPTEIYQEEGHTKFSAVVQWRKGLRLAGNVLKRASLGY